MDPVDLTTLAGTRYRLSHDPAATPGARVDPWLLTMPCMFGTIYPIYPSGPDRLRVDVDFHPRLADRLAALGCELVQCGDGEKTLEFPVAMFPAVAEVVQPRRRRQVSDEERARLRAISGLPTVRASSSG